MTGLALSYDAPSSIAYTPVPPVGAAGEGQLVVRALFTGICGTDLLIWHDGHSRAKPPVVLGHEFAGVVLSVGSGVTDHAVGDLVAVEPLLGCGSCRPCASGAYNQCASLRLIGVDVDGSLAPSVVVPAERAFTLPAGMDAKAGAFVEPTAVVCHVLRRLGPLPARSGVFITGGGPIGLIAAELLLARGNEVMMVEPNPFRAEVAHQLGVRIVASTEEARAAAASLDVPIAGCVEATGVAEALSACVDAADPGGVIVAVGLPKSVPPVDVTTMIAKELDLRGSRVYTREDFKEALESVAAGKLSLDRHITLTIPFDAAIAEGFEAIERRDPILKVMIDQSGDSDV